MAGPRHLYWINQFVKGNLAIMAAPRLDEQFEATILGWKDEGVDVIVSLLEEMELPNLTKAESSLCDEVGVEFISFPVRDKTVPDAIEPVAVIARHLAERIASGKSVAIHCRAGIGRSTTLAACVLIHLGVDGDIALDMIAAARGLEVPETEAQRQWVLSFSHATRDHPT
ncbi:MAG TPA: dual specificity protein phosphatase family protein [Rhizomicrobium sp.]|nr:dual specificity protein phosphatase family protein [Rhizomicrobium sp.]